MFGHMLESKRADGGDVVESAVCRTKKGESLGRTLQLRKWRRVLPEKRGLCKRAITKPIRMKRQATRAGR